MRLEFARKVLVSILTASVFGMSSYVQAYNAGSNSKDYNDTTDGIDTIAIAIGSYTQAGIAPTDNPKLNSEGKYVDKDGKVLVNQTKSPFISVSGTYCTEDNQLYSCVKREPYNSGMYTYERWYYVSEDGQNKIIYDTKDKTYTFYPKNGKVQELSSKQFYSVSSKDIYGNYYAKSDDYNKRVSISQGATAIGNFNKALGGFSTVLGGNNNKAVGKGSTVVGGATPEFVGKAWVTNDSGKYIDSSGQVLINQTSLKLTDISTNPYQSAKGVGGVFCDKNTKDTYRCGMDYAAHCYVFIDKNGNVYRATKSNSLACDFIDQKGNRLNGNNLFELSYVDCNGNYFDENGNPYLKDDFDKRVISETEGALNIVNNLAKGDFSTVIGGTGNLAQGEYSIVAGKNAAGIGTKSVAIGGNAQAILDDSIALGEGAVAKNIHIIDSNAYAGLASNVNNITVLSIGGGTGEDGKVVYRQIQGVAAGEISATSTDAINGSQLYAEVTKYTEKKNEITDKLNTEITERLTIKSQEVGKKKFPYR